MIGRVRGEGRTPWDGPRAELEEDCKRGARGAGSAAPPSAVPHSLGSPRCSLPLRTHGSLKKFPSLAFVFSDKCVQFPLG